MFFCGYLKFNLGVVVIGLEISEMGVFPRNNSVSVSRLVILDMKNAVVDVHETENSVRTNAESDVTRPMKREVVEI